MRALRRPATVAFILVALLIIAAGAALLVRPLYRDARAWWVLNVFAPEWTPAGQMPIERLASPYYHRRLSRVDTLVIHTTEGALASAIGWFRRNPDEVSAHYLIGKDGRIVQMVDERFAAQHAGEVTAPADTRWHEGNPNEYSIGIELENDAEIDDPADLTPAQGAALWALAKDIVSRQHIPVDRQHIVGHSEIDPLNRNDPGPGFPWEEFMRELGE